MSLMIETRALGHIMNRVEFLYIIAHILAWL